MRLSFWRGFMAILFGTFAALGLIGSVGAAGAATGFGSQVAATQWTAMPTAPIAAPPAFDGSVSCVSSNFCVATVLNDGSGANPLVQEWNGSSWSTVTLPLPSGASSAQLSAVSCTSDSFCVAVGTQANASSGTLPLIEQWNGGSWSAGAGAGLPSGFNEAELTGVSCTGPAWCMASGTAGVVGGDTISALAEQWNGSGWSVTTTAATADGADAELAAVSCTTSANCMAVGYTISQSASAVLSKPGSPAAGSFLQAPSGLTAPGLHANADPHTSPVSQLLAEQWNGSSWTVTPTPAPTGITNPEFGGVSCAGAGFCMATGGFESSSGPFAETWSGGAWTQTTLPASPTAETYFIDGVSCISPTSCTSVGEAVTGEDSGDFLGASWNGIGWSLTTVAPPSGQTEAAWLGVSCLAGGYCVGAGATANTSGEDTQPANDQAPIGRTGYRLAASDGGVFSYGPAAPSLGAPFVGSMGGVHLNAPIVGMATMPSGDGYYLVASDGGVFNFGSAPFYGSAGGTHLNQPIVGMAVTADGGGYWLVASDGGVFSYGDAQFYGSAGSIHLNKPIVGMAASPNGFGYYLVAADGGIFTYGNAVYAGSTAGGKLNKPIVGVAVTAAGGYYLVGADGGIFNYGGAPLFGSTGGTRLNKPIVGIGVALGGYYLVASDGGIFAFGGASPPLFYGSAGGTRLNAPIVGIGA
jgi:hypothetical protein